jgi:sensor histidine kinase YesM
VTRRGFWIAQALWWGFYVIVFQLALLPQLDGLRDQLIHLAGKIAKASVGFAASLVLYAIYRRVMPRLRLPELIAVAVIACLTLGMAWELATRMIYRVVLIDDQLVRSAILPTFVLLAWTTMYTSTVYRARADAEAARALKAIALATEAQLAMLRYQVNPHFLFNALNSIRALIGENPTAAREMVTQLSELFRYSLRTTQRADLSVGDEMAAIQNYLDIQRIRFDDALDAAIDADDAAARTQLPGFLIHPLVENAVKYGYETSDPPLRVRVRARRDGDRLDVEVANTGRWLDGGNGNGTGTGLRNLRERLRHLYPDRHSLDIGGDDGWVRIRLVIDVAAEPGARDAGHHAPALELAR